MPFAASPIRRVVVLAGLVGVAVGVVLWGGFNTVMEATNRPEFCISCHVMESTAYQEYRTTVHHRNPSGVRAVCADCHVPRDWTHKVLRKIQATGELWHWALGTIDTPEKFEARRVDLARHEWERMRASDSRECRNCHSFDAMDFHKQKPEAAAAMEKAKAAGQTCIDCHKGIAHRLPDQAVRPRAMLAALQAEAAKAPAGPGKDLLTSGTSPFHLARPAAADAPADGEIAALTPVEVLARDGAWAEIALAGWRRGSTADTLYAQQGRRIPVARLEEKAVAAARDGRTVEDAETGRSWTEIRLSGWIRADRLTADRAGLDAYGAELYRSHCDFCHALRKPDERKADDWIGAMNAMRRYVRLEEGERLFLLKYLQLRAKDAAPPGP